MYVLDIWINIQFWKNGQTIRDVLKSAFQYLFALEEKMNQICDSLGDADPEEMEALMEELGTIQDTLTLQDFYIIDSKVEEVARALGLLDIGLERDVTDLSGRTAHKSTPCQAAFRETRYPASRRANETIWTRNTCVA